MNVISQDVLFHLLLVTSLLLISAHSFGFVANKFKIPVVIGEICAGVFLGQTVLKHIFPGSYDYLFQNYDVTKSYLGIITHFGLLLLMFCSGLEVRFEGLGKNKKLIISMCILGVLLPSAACLFTADLLHLNNYLGPAQNKSALLIVTAIGLSITSIPVISRIFFDLNLIQTSFARNVITTSILQDILLYIVLAVALSLVGAESQKSYLIQYFKIESLSQIIILNVLAAIIFFALAMTVGPKIYHKIENFRFNLFKKGNHTAFLLFFLFMFVIFGILIGVNSMLSAFAAGIVCRNIDQKGADKRKAIRDFAFAFFIPIYFCIVGIKLDLVNNFVPTLCVSFIGIACVIKIFSIFFAAKLSKLNSVQSLNYAIAMNTRGGPGIVLAQLSYDYKIINAEYYVALILLSVGTSILAGVWFRSKQLNIT